AIVPVLRGTLRPLLALAAGIPYGSQILSQREGDVVLQAVTVFLLQLHLERVVPGMAVEGLHAVSLEVGIPSLSKTGFSGRRRVPPVITHRGIEGLNGNELVGIGAGRKVLAVAPDVGGRDDDRTGELALHGEVPLLGIGRHGVRFYRSEENSSELQ